VTSTGNSACGFQIHNFISTAYILWLPSVSGSENSLLTVIKNIKKDPRKVDLEKKIMILVSE
jgi:hypothetical protein